MIAAGVLAPAKINLFLHVLGRRPDGYHLLDSLVVFADIGDRLTARPAPADLSLAVGGPAAGALAGSGADNLVLRAARLLADAVQPQAAAKMRYAAELHLEKVLPVSSGIG